MLKILELFLDLGKQGSVIILRSEKVVKQLAGFWCDILPNIKTFLQYNSYQTVIIHSCENIYRNHKTTRSLGMLLGELNWLIKENSQAEIITKWYSETRVFNAVFKQGTLKRNEKKKLALEFYNLSHQEETKNDNLADAYVLYYYVKELLQKGGQI